jgi:hypothetical protein
MKDIFHLTANPALVHSKFSYPGRNDVAIAIAAQLALIHSPSRFSVLLIGSGVFEPLYCVRSLFLPRNTLVYALDSDSGTISSLERLRAGNGTALFATSEKSDPDSQHGAVIHVASLQEGSFILTNQESERLFTQKANITELDQTCALFRRSYDLIVCNNLLANMLTMRHVSELKRILRAFARCLSPNGCLLLGTIDCSLYPSQNHPGHIREYAAQSRAMFRSVPLKLAFWCNRALVSEMMGPKRIIDGYSYLFFTKRHSTCRPSLADQLSSYEFIPRRSSLEVRRLPRHESVWHVSRKNYIWWASAHPAGTQCLLDAHFPQSSIATLGGESEFHPRILEHVLQKMQRPGSNNISMQHRAV